MIDKEKLIKIKKLADKMYDAAFYLTTDASLLRKAMDEYHKFVIHECKEEPVNESLEKASTKYAQDKYMPVQTSQAFKAGAEWQRQNDERLIWQISSANYEKGKKEGKEQLIKDATEVTVHIDAGNYPYIPQIELYDYDKDIPLAKEGDKYKVILIKED